MLLLHRNWGKIGQVYCFLLKVFISPKLELQGQNGPCLFYFFLDFWHEGRGPNKQVVIFDVIFVRNSYLLEWKLAW